MVLQRLLAAGLVLMLGCGCQGQRDLYVDTLGSDQNNCSLQYPCRTIGHAVNMSQDGDTIILNGDNSTSVYDINDISLTHALTLQSKNGQAQIICKKPTLTRCNFDLKGANVSTGNHTREVSPSIKLKVSGLSLKQCNICATDFCVSFHNTQLQNGHILAETHHQGMAVDFRNSSVENSQIELNQKKKKQSPYSQSQVTAENTVFTGQYFSLNNSKNFSSLSVSFDHCLFDYEEGEINLTYITTLNFIINNSIFVNVSTLGSIIEVDLSSKTAGEIYIKNSTFMDCFALQGVIYILTGKTCDFYMLVEDSLFMRNKAYKSGTAIQLELDPEGHSNQTVEIKYSNFTDNLNFMSGGAINIGGRYASITNCNFTRNRVETVNDKVEASVEHKGSGGAIYVYKEANASIISCSFIHNSAVWFGGSIAGGGTVYLEDVNFENTPFSDKQALVGDVIYLFGDVKMGNITVNVLSGGLGLPIIWYSGARNQLQPLTNSIMNFTCPVGSNFRNVSLPVMSQDDSEVISFKDLLYFCNPCDKNQYSLQQGYKFSPMVDLNGNWSSDFQCFDCSYGGICARGNIMSKPGYWGYQYNNPPQVKFTRCMSGYCCEPANATAGFCPTYHTCAEGRNGTLCGSCKEGMSEILFDAECRDNEKCNDLWFLGVQAISSVVYLLFFLYQLEVTNFIIKYLLWLPMSDIDDAAMAAYIKTIFYFYQTVGLLKIQENQVSKMLEHFALEPFIMLLLNFQPLAALWGVCPFRDLTPEVKAFMNNMSLVYLVVLTGILYFIIKVFEIVRYYRRKKTSNYAYQTLQSRHGDRNTASSDEYSPTFKSRLALACISILLFNYINMSTMTFSLLSCVPIDGHLALYLDGNISCYQPWQIVFIIFALVYVIPFFMVVIVSVKLLKSDKIGIHQFFLSYLLPLPLLMYWAVCWLWDFRKARSSSLVDSDSIYTTPILNDILASETPVHMTPEAQETNDMKIDIIFLIESAFINPENEDKSASYWEGILILRRLILSLMATFIYFPLLSVTLQTLICLAFLLWHLYIHPFGSKSANYLETSSLTVLTTIAIFHLVQATFQEMGQLPAGPSKSQIYVFDWIEWVLLTGFPLLLGLIFVLSLLLRTFLWIIKGVKYCYHRAKIHYEYKQIQQSDYLDDR